METAQNSVRAMPCINEPAPAFEARTTHGVKKLEDYRGKWLVLFSHPADFTPVCTTEFMAFARRYADFQALNTERLGLSIDSYYSHVAWVRNIKEKFAVEIPFPIIEDLSMTVAHAFGMIHPGAADTSAGRATFIIDPEGVLRAMGYCPMTNGRSINEFVRLVAALQTSDANTVATPEAWRPGDKVIVPPPANMDAAEVRVNEGYECTDWYFCKKALQSEPASTGPDLIRARLFCTMLSLPPQRGNPARRAYAEQARWRGWPRTGIWTLTRQTFWHGSGSRQETRSAAAAAKLNCGFKHCDKRVRLFIQPAHPDRGGGPPPHHRPGQPARRYFPPKAACTFFSVSRFCCRPLTCFSMSVIVVPS
jgi:peroxiredoxin (alkyl hydroperoxide reductase subunit C)